jgi:hypothetical protein
MSDLLPRPRTHTPVAEPTQIRFDIYPATVAFSFGSHMFNKVRAIVTADQVVVLVDDQGGPSELYSGKLENIQGTRRHVQVETADGVITIERAQGCGCGSHLKNYKPFTRAARIA